MWNLFRRKNRGSSAQPPKAPEDRVNRVDELADTLQREGRVKELEQELKKLDQSSLSPAEQESWWQVYGMSAFQEGRDAEALERLEEAYRRFPQSADIRFSLGQQYIRARAVEKGFGLFRTCLFPEVPREYALAQARYAYLWNRYSDGLLFIRPFFEAYKQIKILDDSFLYVRGLPFFGRWWGHLAAFAILSGELEELESVTKFVVQNCHDYDFDYLQAELKAYRDDSPEYLLETLEGRLSSTPAGNFPTGYTHMNVAVIKARAATTIEAAQGVLASVTLSEMDSPWLEDIRTLALAEAAHRLGDPTLERERVGTFLMRQPALLWPDVALKFHLLRYQEHLKPRVTSR
jgi:tetratricopeptide (TPR) repeat protein